MEEGSVKAFILLVTWFYGQPATSHAEFTSMEACMEARKAVLEDAQRLKDTAEGEAQKRLQAQGIASNPMVPTVSAVCAAQ
jgi:hypothetical protein